MKTVEVYLHGNRESMYEAGEKLGLSGEVLRLFSFTGYKEKITYEVDEATGESRAVAFNGRKIE